MAEVMCSSHHSKSLTISTLLIVSNFNFDHMVKVGLLVKLLFFLSNALFLSSKSLRHSREGHLSFTCWREVYQRICGHMLKVPQSLVNLGEVFWGYANILFLLNIFPTDCSIHQCIVPVAIVTTVVLQWWFFYFPHSSTLINRIFFGKECQTFFFVYSIVYISIDSQTFILYFRL